MSDPLRQRLLAAYGEEYRDHVAALRAALAAGADADWEEAYRHAHSLKGAARAVDLPAVVDLAHGLESQLEAWWEGGAVADPPAIAHARAAIDAIEDASATAIAGDGAATRAPDPVAATLRVQTEAADRLAGSTAHLLAELERQRGGDDAVRRLAAGVPPGLRGLVDELARRLADREWALTRAAEAVAEDVARLRLVAAEAVLGNFGPMLRALAADMGKEIRFEAHGLDIQADREVLAAMAEAVMHLLRNAVAHGIESPAARLAAGKDATGRLGLALVACGHRLEVRVSDDGAGISGEKLARAAVARGVLTPAQAARADGDRLRQLVFHPGLSTAGGIDTTAGRGMGMSIVRRLMDRLQGDVALWSQPGQGTRVVMTVPISILAQRVVLVRAGGRRFALPAPSLVRILTLPHGAVMAVDGGAVAVIDGTEVPLADLAGLLGLAGQPRRGDSLCVVLIRVASETVGLVVEGVEDVRDLPVTPLEPALVDDPRLVGTVTLERGVLVPVLSPAGLRGVPLSPGLLGGAPAAGLPPLVLVVDDSPTIRTLERTILEAHSYRVETAVDGRDAWERMARSCPDLVVSDVEMPRLDGFGLLAAMRADPGLARVPVVLVSSRASPEDIRRGKALGAAEYLPKTRFDQRAFLDTIGRLTS